MASHIFLIARTNLTAQQLMRQSIEHANLEDMNDQAFYSSEHKKGGMHKIEV